MKLHDLIKTALANPSFFAPGGSESSYSHVTNDHVKERLDAIKTFYDENLEVDPEKF
jgi:hypothetical protein